MQMMSVYCRWSFGVLLWELATMGKIETELAWLRRFVGACFWKWAAENDLCWVVKIKDNPSLSVGYFMGKGEEGLLKEWGEGKREEATEIQISFSYSWITVPMNSLTMIISNWCPTVLKKGTNYVIQEDQCCFAHIPTRLSNPF